MQNKMKFLWRPLPPETTDPLHIRAARQLRQSLADFLPSRPWSKQLSVHVSADNRGQPAVWVILPSAIDALWAASMMGQFNRTVSAVAPEIRHLVVMAPKQVESGYAPMVSWRFGQSDYRPRTIRKSERQAFIHYLNWCAAKCSTSIKGHSGTKLLLYLATSRALHWEAINAFINHASAQQFLTCSVSKGLSEVIIEDGACQPDWACPGGVTRWQATKTLVENGWIEDFVGRQRPLRPPLSTATLIEIRNFVAKAFQLTPEDLTGESRHAHIMHARQMSAAVMRRVTSRTLAEIGDCLGGRDHSTVMNGLERIENWKRTDSMHNWIVESFAQVADNMGILKVPSFHKMAVEQLKLQRKLMAENSRPRDPSPNPPPKGGPKPDKGHSNHNWSPFTDKS